MVWLRKIIFVCFLVAYLILCPLTVLYVLGYVIQPAVSQGIIKTGLIVIRTVPSGASIYLNGKRFAKRSPAILHRLLPGSYQVKITLPGYAPWIRRVNVEPQKATALDHVLFVPKHLQPVSVLEGPYQNLIPIPQTRWLLLAGTKRLANWVVYDWQSRKGYPVISDSSVFGNAEVIEPITMEESPLVLLRVQDEGIERFLAVELSSHGTHSLRDISPLFPKSLEQVIWEGHQTDFLFTFQEHYVNRVDPQLMAIYPRIVEKVSGFGTDAEGLYVLTEDGSLIRLDFEGTRPEAIFEQVFINPAWLNKQAPIHLFVFPRHFFMGRTKGRECFLIHPSIKWHEQGIQDFLYERQQHRLWIWRKRELGILKLPSMDRDTDSEKMPRQRPLNVQWILKDAENLRQVFGVHEGSHVLVLDGDRVFLQEITAESDTAVERYPLIQVLPRSTIVYVESEGLLYYLDPTTKSLTSLTLVPDRSAPSSSSLLSSVSSIE